MPNIIKKGPLSAEDAAEGWAIKLYERLRHGRQWRDDADAILKEEYARLAGTAADGGTLGVHTMWEYYQLVQATNQYLRTNPNRALAAWFHERVVRDLGYAATHLAQFLFDERERGSMVRAFDRMAPTIKKWADQE